LIGRPVLALLFAVTTASTSAGAACAAAPERPESRHEMEAGRVCERHPAGLAPVERPASALERDRAMFRAHAQRLALGNVLIAADPPPEPPVTVEQILAALASETESTAESGAFLAGRCRAPEGDGELAAALRAAVRSHPNAIARLEAALSLVLRGEPKEGLAGLRAALSAKDPFDEPYKAAVYLAELGHPEGWPVFLRALRGDIAQQRILATRYVLAFLPFDGRTEGGARVDVAAALRERAADELEYVRREVPARLALVRPPDLRELLAKLAADPDPVVRTLSQSALESLAP
jgi:hypothetical protein